MTDSNDQQERINPFASALTAVLGTVDADDELLSDAVTGLASGFRHLDLYTQGFFDGELILVGGRPGTFKTPFLLALFQHACESVVDGRRPVYFTLEASVQMTSFRILAQLSGISMVQFRRGRLLEESVQPLVEAATHVHHGALSEALIFDHCLDIIAVKAEITRLRAEGIRPAAIFLDYVQLLRGGSQFGTRADELAFISRELKLLAREVGCPVIAASQVTRGVEDRVVKQALLSDLRGGGSLEEDADLVLLLRRLDQPSNGALDGKDYWLNLPAEQQVDLELFIAKDRYGQAGICLPLTISQESGQFRGHGSMPSGS